MSSEEERKAVFAWFGAASYQAQCVETELWIARLTLAREHDSEPTDQAWSQIEGERLTMNQLLQLVSGRIKLGTAEREVLETCRDKRNWLAHKYWEERSHLLWTSQGCGLAMNELAGLCETFKRGDEVAQTISARIRARVGISEDLVWRLQEECVRRLRAGESHEVILDDVEQRMQNLASRLVSSDGQLSDLGLNDN